MDSLSGYSAFLDLGYWFNLYPVPLGPSLVAQIFTFFAFFVVVGIALHVVAHMLRKKDALLSGLLRRFAKLLSWTGGLGWLFLFFTYEQSPLLGMRFWFLAILTLFFVWLVRIVIYAVKEFPALRMETRTRQDFERWLPHPKK